MTLILLVMLKQKHTKPQCVFSCWLRLPMGYFWAFHNLLLSKLLSPTQTGSVSFKSRLLHFWMCNFRKKTTDTHKQKRPSKVTFEFIPMAKHTYIGPLFEYEACTAACTSCQVMQVHVSGTTVKQRVAEDCRSAGLARRIKTLVGNKGEVKGQICLTHTHAHWNKLLRQSPCPDHLLN